MKKITRKPTLAILILLSAFLSSAIAADHNPDTGKAEENDGPYVFVINNQRIVSSLINGEVETRRYAAKARIRLHVPGVSGLTVSLPPSTPGFRRGQVFQTEEKIFALSDVHGQFLRLREILVGNRIMNNRYQWTFGKGHLVVVGDIFDRGPMVTECLWLMIHLQTLAHRAGGRVHVLLGNHEMMALRGDLRYVNKRYQKIARKLYRIPYPDLFGPDTYLGRWLRVRPAVIRINDILFVHAGIHPELVKLAFSIKRINRTVHRHLDSSGVVHAFHPRVKAVFDRNGVFWSRGYFGIEGYDPVDTRGLSRVLSFYGASRVVVGHTRFDNISTHMDGRVIGTAVNTEDDQPAEGLLIHRGRFFRADHTGNQEEIIFSK